MVTPYLYLCHVFWKCELSRHEVNTCLNHATNYEWRDMVSLFQSSWSVARPIVSCRPDLSMALNLFLQSISVNSISDMFHTVIAWPGIMLYPCRFSLYKAFQPSILQLCIIIVFPSFSVENAAEYCQISSACLFSVTCCFIFAFLSLNQLICYELYCAFIHFSLPFNLFHRHTFWLIC